MKLTRVYVPQECGGGHITLKCEPDTTIITLKHMAIDKIRQKRLQEKLTGSVHLKVEDFGLSSSPPDWKVRGDSKETEASSEKLEIKSSTEKEDPRLSLRYTTGRPSLASPVAAYSGTAGTQEKEHVLSDDTVVFQALHVKPDEEKGETNLTLYLILTNAAERFSPENLIEVSGLVTLQGSFLASDGTGTVGIQSTTGPQTAWTLITSEGNIFIRDYRGQYLTSDPSGKVYTARQGGDWGYWTMEAGQYFISTHNRYLSVEDDGKVFCHESKTEFAKFDACGPVVEGYLRKLATKGVRKARWQRRYFVLSEHKLAYWHMKPKPGSHELPKGVFTTRGIENTPNEKNDKRFAVLLKGKRMELLAESHQQRTMWLTALARESAKIIESALSPSQKEAIHKKRESVSPSTSPSASPSSSPGSKWDGVHSFLVNAVKFTVDKKYSPVKPLGTGAYGTVCLAVDRSQNLKKMAIKKIPNAFEDLVDGKRIIREAKLLRHFKHPNVIALRDLINPPEGQPLDDVYMVMDFMETDLHKIIYSKNVLTDEHIQYFIYQTLKGLKYIHSASVIHRDLKPSNLLLNPNCDLKICDFGLARGLKSAAEQDYELTEYVVTRWYRAPDVMCSTNPYDAKIDVWAVGCILCELHGRQPIFPGEDTIKQMELIFNVLGTPTEDDMTDFVTNPRAKDFILSLKKRPKTPFSTLFPTANPLALDLMDRMLQFNPGKRISVDDALKHAYFKTLHNPKKEIECKTKFNFDFEKQKMTGQVLRDLMWEEIYAFRPHLSEKLASMKAKDKAARARRETAALSVSLTAADSFPLGGSEDAPSSATGFVDTDEEIDDMDGFPDISTSSTSSSSSSSSSSRTSSSSSHAPPLHGGTDVGSLPPIPETPTPSSETPRESEGSLLRNTKPAPPLKPRT